MLITDLRIIGDNFFAVRKRNGLTQAEVAEKAEISDRTYADIERGKVNLRTETLLKICQALDITPNDILVSNDDIDFDENLIINKLEQAASNDRATAFKILNAYLSSLNK